jgi:hypothetical protein
MDSAFLKSLASTSIVSGFIFQNGRAVFEWEQGAAVRFAAAVFYEVSVLCSKSGGYVWACIGSAAGFSGLKGAFRCRIASLRAASDTSSFVL